MAQDFRLPGPLFLVKTCQYGENAWQTPAHLLSTSNRDPLALDKFQVIEGTDPSYNNWADIDRLLQTATHIASGFKRNRNAHQSIALGVKHGNACGASAGANNEEVLKKMFAGDPISIFGGLVLVNFKISGALSRFFSEKLLDGIIAPEFDPEAVATLKRKNGKCRLITNPALAGLSEKLDEEPRFRQVRGGFLVQPNYTFVPCLTDEGIVKYGQASSAEEYDLILAWAIGSTSNSNTITLAKDGMLIGNGVCQQDRVGAAKLAVSKAVRSHHRLIGAVAYSDSFFPFPDGPRVLIDAGVRAIFTTSGSIRDSETIEICEKNRVALYMIKDQVGRGFFGH